MELKFEEPQEIVSLPKLDFVTTDWRSAVPLGELPLDEFGRPKFDVCVWPTNGVPCGKPVGETGMHGAERETALVTGLPGLCAEHARFFNQLSPATITVLAIMMREQAKKIEAFEQKLGELVAELRRRSVWGF